MKALHKFAIYNQIEYRWEILSLDVNYPKPIKSSLLLRKMYAVNFKFWTVGRIDVICRDCSWIVVLLAGE